VQYTAQAVTEKSKTFFVSDLMIDMSTARISGFHDDVKIGGGILDCCAV
jgi:hypothetical protein